jgi:hypothetical protein
LAKTSAKIFEAVSLDGSSANERTPRAFFSETATRGDGDAKRDREESAFRGDERAIERGVWLSSERQDIVARSRLEKRSRQRKRTRRRISVRLEKALTRHAKAPTFQRDFDLLRSRKENRSVENVPPESDIALGFSCCFVRAKFPPAQTDEPYKIEYSVLFFFERSAAAKRARSPSSRARAPPLLRFFGGRRGHNFTRLAGRAP